MTENKKTVHRYMDGFRESEENDIVIAEGEVQSKRKDGGVLDPNGKVPQAKLFPDGNIRFLPDVAFALLALSCC